MKTGIITFHFVNNFGGALQAYALKEAIRNNCDTKIEVIAAELVIGERVAESHVIRVSVAYHHISFGNGKS